MRRAFTLTELLVTISVMGLLGGIAINVFFPSITKTYVAMLKQDMGIQAQKNLEFFSKTGTFLYSNGKKLKPTTAGVVIVDMGNKGKIRVPTTYYENGSYEVKFNRGTCSDTGKPGMIIETWLNRATPDVSPVLYGKYDSCKYSMPRVWEKLVINGRTKWVER